MKAKNKLGFIDGSIMKTKMKTNMQSDELNAWKIINSMMTSWIMNVIDLKLHTSVAYVNLAQAMLNNIQKRYTIPNIPRIQRLKAEMHPVNRTNMKCEFLFKAYGFVE